MSKAFWNSFKILGLHGNELTLVKKHTHIARMTPWERLKAIGMFRRGSGILPKRGLLYNSGQRKTPPGFVQTLGGKDDVIIGVLPEKDGSCNWVKILSGERDPKSTSWGTLNNCDKVSAQRAWLKNIRAAVGWGEIQDACSVSKRTWEGWEGGKRKVPYHQAAILSNLVWERIRFAPRGMNPIFIQTPKRITFKPNDP